MSEIIREGTIFPSAPKVGEAVFELYETHGEYGYDLDESVDQVTQLVVDRYHLQEDYARIATDWARDAWSYLRQLDMDEWSKDTICHALILAKEGITIPHGTTENRPLFRVKFCAEQALIELAGENGAFIERTLYGDKQRIFPDFEQTDLVITTLLDSFNNQYWPFNNDKTRVPQDPRHTPRRPEFQHSPEERTDEESIKLAQFWFAVCYYMRGVNDSIDTTINMADMYEKHPEMFDFHIAATMQPEEVDKLLLEHHLAVQHKAISGYWVENAKRMVEHYDGDPRKIFENYKDFDELSARICNDKKGGGFLGFQKKMASMSSYYNMYLGLVPVRNIPLPTDFHVVRTAIEQEMVTFENMPESGVVDFAQLKDFLREVFFDVSEHTGLSQLDICDVIWLYSGNACVNSPTNRQILLDRYKDEDGNTVWEYSEPIINADDATPAQISTYANSCGLCRLRETCRHDVPSKEYYDRGIVRYPKPKTHFKLVQPSMYDDESLLVAQKPVKPGTTTHSIDVRTGNRMETQKRRLSLIRKLAHNAFFGLSEEYAQRIMHSMVETNSMPGESLAGKNYAFTPNEVIQALKRVPSPDEEESLAPYMAKAA